MRYDDEAAAYCDLWAPILRTAGLRLLAALAGRKAKRIVDIGSGVGSLLPDLRAKFPGAFVVAVDRSRPMLTLAPPGFPRAVMDASQLAVAPASVDLALLVFMLFHVPSPQAALGHVHRILRPGGRAGLLTWAGDLEFRAARVWTECLDAHGASPTDPATETRHEPFDSPEKMAAFLVEAGFRSVEAWEEELVRAIDLEHLLLLRTRMGAARPRFESLDADARTSCVAEARRRMSSLAPADFVARGGVVYAVGDA